MRKKTKNTMRRPPLMARLRRALRDCRGVSAIEFALIMPVMLTFYFGAVEISQVLTVDRKVTKAVSTVGDLVARSVSLTNAEVNDIFQVTAQILQPFNPAGLQIRITSVMADINNNTKVDWSDGFNMPALAQGAPVTLPQGLSTPLTSVVRVEVAYTYTSVFGEFTTGGVTMNDTFFLRPREVAQIGRTP